MFHILGFLLIIIVIILVIGLSIIGTVIRSIFGLKGRRPSKQQSATTPKEEEEVYGENKNQPKHKKLFSKDEGEYVDFEEIREK